MAAIGLTMLPLAPVQAASAPTNTTSAPVKAAAASAKKIKLSASVEKKIRAGLKSYGVKASVRDSLIKKLKAGKRWDSVIKGKKAKAVKRYTSTKYRYARLTFADGSILVERTNRYIPKPNPNFVTQVSGENYDCAKSTSNFYYVSGTGCRIWASSILFSVEYSFDFEAARDYRRIIRAYNLTGGGVQAGPQNLHFEWQSDWDVRAYFTQSIGIGDVKLTMPYYLGLRISGSGGYSTYEG